MSTTGTIQEIVLNELCTGCGTCVAFCPKSAITLVRDYERGIYVPHVDTESCHPCGICLRVCPGTMDDPGDLNRAIFGTKQENGLLGSILCCYSGYSTDEGVRYSASSGGLVSQILIFALEHGIIDGALVTRMNEKKPLEPEPFIARSREEILSAVGSKYCPVPVNVLLRDILSQDGKFAVVGLPCHIRGVRKAEMIYEKLAKRIVLHIGLICSHTLNFLATDFLLQPYLTNVGSTVTRLRYRGHGWPGFLTAQTADGERFSLPFQKFGRMHILHFFAPRRCLICADQSCELADLSFGDAWLTEFANDKVGRSVVVSRNLKAEAILQQAREEHIVALDNLSRDSFVRSQRQVLCFKKKTVRAHYRLNYRGGIPSYLGSIEPTLPDYGLAALFHFNNQIASRRALWRLIYPLTHFQMPLLKLLSRLSTGNDFSRES